MNRSRPTHHKQLQLEQQRKAALICVSVMLHQRLFASLYLFFCVCCKLLPNVFHTNDMFALSEKSAEKKTKTGRLPIAHYKQKPAGSDLWPVNRCIPSSRVTSPKNENLPVFYSPSGHSRCIWLSSFRWIRSELYREGEGDVTLRWVLGNCFVYQTAILRGSSCLSTIEFRAIFRFSVVIVENVTIVCHSCCIENCKSNSIIVLRENCNVTERMFFFLFSSYKPQGKQVVEMTRT